LRSPILPVCRPDGRKGNPLIALPFRIVGRPGPKSNPMVKRWLALRPGWNFAGGL